MEQETKAQGPYIFVSYSSKDEAKVHAITEEMERQGYHVWVDSGNDGIAGGDVLARTIEERIQNCGVFIPFLSENYYASKWCRQELTYANSREKPMIPVKSDDTELGRGFGVLLGAYRFLQYHDARSLILELKKSKEFEKCGGNPIHIIRGGIFQSIDFVMVLRKLINRLRPKHPKRLIAGLLLLGVLLGIPCGWYAVKFGTGPIWTYQETDKYIPLEGMEGVTQLVKRGVLTISRGLFSGNMPDYNYTKSPEYWNPAPWAGNADTTEAVIISKGVTSIGSKAFEDFRRMKYIYIPDSVTTIGNSVFSGCTALEKISVPDGVTEIGEYTFSGCTALESISIPNSVTAIGLSAFSGCTALESISIPYRIKEIGPVAFSGCIALESISVPTSVTEIGLRAFFGCTSLKTVTIYNDADSIYIASDAFPPETEIIYAPPSKNEFAP